MKDHTRRAVAYIAARLLGETTGSAVYDYSASKHFHFGGDVDASRCSAYDYEQRCHISGTPPTLYHHGNCKHLSIKADGTGFTGYDYDTGKHFSGSVRGCAISVYDYDGGRHYNYSV